MGGGEGWKGSRVPAAAPLKFYMPLVVTGQVPQFLASIFKKEAEQTVKICNRNPMQKKAHLTPRKVAANPQKDVGFKLGCPSLEFSEG